MNFLFFVPSVKDGAVPSVDDVAAGGAVEGAPPVSGACGGKDPHDGDNDDVLKMGDLDQSTFEEIQRHLSIEQSAMVTYGLR